MTVLATLPVVAVAVEQATADVEADIREPFANRTLVLRIRDSFLDAAFGEVRMPLSTSRRSDDFLGDLELVLRRP